MKTEKNENSEKTRIYNVVILDASGSMHPLSEAVVDGVNEVLSGISKAGNDFFEDQEHFFTLVSFDNKVSKVYDCVSPSSISHFTTRDYHVGGCTALYDAIGKTLSDLEKVVDSESDAVGAVTIITDGYENASVDYSLSQVVTIIDRLKEKGWTFAFMGANQDVEHTTTVLHIDNSITFHFSDEGMRESWRRDREAKERYYQRMQSYRSFTRDMSPEERHCYYRDEERRNQYFDSGVNNVNKWCIPADRITPSYITHLNKDEIFVFGSNIDGIHNGGAAEFAYIRFGAEMGRGEGLQGHSYAIPTSDGMAIMVKAVRRFIEFARAHPELKFLVTAVGCGVSRYSPDVVAPLFRDASSLNNVFLPEVFWHYI